MSKPQERNKAKRLRLSLLLLQMKISENLKHRAVYKAVEYIHYDDGIRNGIIYII